MPPIKVYGQPNCPACKVAVGVLQRAAIEIEYHDVQQEPESAQRLKALGYLTTPVFEDGDEHFPFDPDRLKRSIASRVS